MKRNLFAVLSIVMVLTACTGTKKTNAMDNTHNLNGTWELNYISGPRIAFDGLYPDKKPFITFDVANKKINGNTSCNNFNGPFKVEGKAIDFTSPLAMTRMMCPGEGEMTFIKTLEKVTSWSITDENTLNLIMGDESVMRFSRIARQ